MLRYVRGAAGMRVADSGGGAAAAVLAVVVLLLLRWRWRGAGRAGGSMYGRCEGVGMQGWSWKGRRPGAFGGGAVDTVGLWA